jgi:prevent-host-death family protein
MQEAKTNLSKLVAYVQEGKEVIIANRGVPVVRLEAISKSEKRELGFMKGHLPDSFFDPLSEDELEEWNL